MTTRRKRTEKSRYKHESTGDYCTCQAYVAEILCKRFAEFKNVGSLAYKFWNHKPWNWTFKKQLWLASSMIQKYGEEAVVRAVTSPEFGTMFSLKNKRAEPIIKKYSAIIKKEKESKQELKVKEKPVIRKSSYGRKVGINKLRGLDGGSNGKNQSEQEED